VIETGTFHGAALRRDVATAMGERALRSALAAGVLVQPWRGVIIRSTDALDLRTRAAAAVLATGRRGVLSGPTAVALHGCEAAQRSAAIHVTVPYSGSTRSRPGLVLHQNRFSPEDVTHLDGLPVFAADRALADYLCDGDKRSAFAGLDQALALLPEAQRPRLGQAVRQRLAERDDRRGVHRARMLVELATGKAQSPPESIFRLIVVEAGYPIPEPQYEVRTLAGRLLYLLDMAWESHRVALEYDGVAAHEDRADADAERDRRMAERGWTVVRARAADLGDPSRVLADLRSAFAARSAMKPGRR
jgi:hypothetical protein